jgi:hypothetical protein
MANTFVPAQRTDMYGAWGTFYANNSAAGTSITSLGGSGSVTVTNGSATVTGSGTSWTSALNGTFWTFSAPAGTMPATNAAGDAISYTATVNSTTSLTISPVYQGTSGASRGFAFGSNAGSNFVGWGAQPFMQAHMGLAMHYCSLTMNGYDAPTASYCSTARDSLVTWMINYGTQTLGTAGGIYTGTLFPGCVPPIDPSNAVCAGGDPLSMDIMLWLAMSYQANPQPATLAFGDLMMNQMFAKPGTGAPTSSSIYLSAFDPPGGYYILGSPPPAKWAGQCCGYMSAVAAWPAATATVTPTECTYALNAGGQTGAAAFGSGTISITTNPGCYWSVTNLPNWVTLTSAAAGTGSGTVTYDLAPNLVGDRSGSLMIGGLSFTIEQQAASIPGLSFIGSMPQIVAEENWTTEITLVNKGASAATARLSFFADSGSMLTLPLTFPQQPSGPNPLLGASLDQTISPNAMLIIDTAGPQVPPVQIGSAQVAATGAVDGFAILHLIPSAQEAAVPIETRNASSYVLAFDNTNSMMLSVAVANVSVQAANVRMIVRDDAGTQIASGAIALPGNGHTSFVLSDPSSGFPATANQRGTIEFDTPLGGQISVLGFRTIPLETTTTLTTIPALANVGSSGGSIADLATGDGWQTTFVLVNVGASAAQVQLTFFDDNGNTLPLPIGFPQSSTGAITMASAVDQTLAAGATLLVQSTGTLTDPFLSGSAQITSSGSVSGFVIFRYGPTGQEMVVPLESRNANAYILAFDNTNGVATGVAISNVSLQAVSVPVMIYDDAGEQIGTGSIPLAANGHSAFVLSNQFPVTANIRGTIEFDTPIGGQISTLGIRTPITKSFTALPVLVK